MLKARSAGGRQTRSRTAKTTPKRASAPAKKASEEKKADAGESYRLKLLASPLYSCQAVQLPCHAIEAAQHAIADIVMSTNVA